MNGGGSSLVDDESGISSSGDHRNTYLEGCVDGCLVGRDAGCCVGWLVDGGVGVITVLV